MKICVECGDPFKSKHGNQKYCASCKVEVRKEQNRINTQNYRKRWRHLWGRNNKKESLGSGFITSPHMKEDHEEEKKIVRRELQRFGIKPKSQRV